MSDPFDPFESFWGRFWLFFGIGLLLSLTVSAANDWITFGRWLAVGCLVYSVPSILVLVATLLDALTRGKPILRMGVEVIRLDK